MAARFALVLSLLALPAASAPGRTPRCHVSFTQATRDNPSCSLTAPCVEGQPCSTSAQKLACGEKASGCGRTFECRCPKPEAPRRKRR